MKKYFIEYKPFLSFLGKFLLVYALLTFIYEKYLSQFDTKKFEVDGFTQLVSRQTVSLMHFFGLNASQNFNPFEPNMQMFYNNNYVARIIEGCNGLSVIILFIAFVIAFTGKFKHTILFIASGTLIIHVFNVARIALLCVLITKYPKYKSILHDIVFPLIIYGTVFLLWIIWVNKFSRYATKTVQ